MRIIAVSALAILVSTAADGALAPPAEACSVHIAGKQTRGPRKRTKPAASPIATAPTAPAPIPRNAPQKQRLIDSGPGPGGRTVRAAEPPVAAPAPVVPAGVLSIEIEVYFASASTSVDESAAASLAPVVTWLQANPRGVLVAVGHADADGPARYNLDLSRRRAVAVKRFLVERAGIAPDRIRVAARGETQLADPTDAAKNRRVEIRRR